MWEDVVEWQDGGDGRPDRDEGDREGGRKRNRRGGRVREPADGKEKDPRAGVGGEGRKRRREGEGWL